MDEQGAGAVSLIAHKGGSHSSGVQKKHLLGLCACGVPYGLSLERSVKTLRLDPMRVQMLHVQAGTAMKVSQRSIAVSSLAVAAGSGCVVTASCQHNQLLHRRMSLFIAPLD